MKPKDSYGDLKRGWKLWARARRAYPGYDLVRDSCAMGNKPLAMADPLYFTVTVVPSLKASSPATAVPTVQS